MIQSGLQQNVLGLDSNIGYFYDGFYIHGGNHNLINVQVGWYAQGEGVVNGLVVDVNQAEEKITIALPNRFKSGKSYTFTSEPVPVISNTCFPKGTPITTNQGTISIEEINPNKHTIRNKKIVAVTQTVSTEDSLICFEKNSLGNQIPSQRTIMSMNHVVFFGGMGIQAKKFVGKVENIKKVDYNGEILYNILLEDYDKMLVNNIIVETLHPSNRVAKLFRHE